MPTSPSASARRRRCARWRRRVPRTPSPWPFPAIGSCAPTARSPAIDGASSASARCSPARPPRDRRPPPADASSERRHRRAHCRRSTGPTSPHASRRRARRHGPVLTPDECAALAATYDVDARFRSRVVMARHGFGRGEYKYFAHPLPASGDRAPHGALSRPGRHRQSLERDPGHGRALSRRSRGVSRRAVIGPGRRSRPRSSCATAPATTIACTRTCTASTSSRCRRPFLLSVPGRDFTGGEFVLTEQRPRMQSRADVVPLGQGDGVIFPGAAPAGARHPRQLSRHPAPRREPGALRPAPHPRHHLPRRPMKARGSAATGQGGAAVGDLFDGGSQSDASVEGLAEGATVLRALPSATPRPCSRRSGRPPSRPVPAHGDSRRIQHVRGHDQLRSGRLGDGPVRLSL